MKKIDQEFRTEWDKQQEGPQSSVEELGNLDQNQSSLRDFGVPTSDQADEIELPDHGLVSSSQELSDRSVPVRRIEDGQKILDAHKVFDKVPKQENWAILNFQVQPKSGASLGRQEWNREIPGMPPEEENRKADQKNSSWRSDFKGGTNCLPKLRFSIDVEKQESGQQMSARLVQTRKEFLSIEEGCQDWSKYCEIIVSPTKEFSRGKDRFLKSNFQMKNEFCFSDDMGSEFASVGVCELMGMSFDAIDIGMNSFRTISLGPLENFSACEPFDEMPIRSFKGNDSNNCVLSNHQERMLMGQGSRIFDPGDFIDLRFARRVGLEHREFSKLEAAVVEQKCRYHGRVIGDGVLMPYDREKEAPLTCSQMVVVDSYMFIVSLFATEVLDVYLVGSERLKVDSNAQKVDVGNDKKLIFQFCSDYIVTFDPGGVLAFLVTRLAFDSRGCNAMLEAGIIDQSFQWDPGVGFTDSLSSRDHFLKQMMTFSDNIKVFKVLPFELRCGFGDSFKLSESFIEFPLQTLVITVFDPGIIHKLNLQAVLIDGCWVLSGLIFVFDPGGIGYLLQVLLVAIRTVWADKCGYRSCLSATVARIVNGHFGFYGINGQGRCLCFGSLEVKEEMALKSVSDKAQFHQQHKAKIPPAFLVKHGPNSPTIWKT